MPYIFRKIVKEEFYKLRDLFPDTDTMWEKFKEKRLKQFDELDIDIYVIEENDKIIGEISVNYSSHDLESETIPKVRVYLEAFRLDKKYQGKGLGQKLIKYTISDLEQNGYKEFTIGVEENNEVAKHIYFKCGFTEAIDKGHGNEYDPCDYTLYIKRIKA